MPPTRYAVFFTPAVTSRLWKFGLAVIGYDSNLGERVEDRSRGKFAELLPGPLIAEPARYGFHATLRAPFELIDGATTGDVINAMHDFAKVHQSVALGRLSVEPMSTFLALQPLTRSNAMLDFAGRCVEHFQRLRRPLGEADRARRMNAGLTTRQVALLDTYGYPYVLEQYRFHMTLTGALPPEAMAQVQSRLQAAYADIDWPVDIDAITLLEQPSRDQPFRTITRLPLRISR